MDFYSLDKILKDNSEKPPEILEDGILPYQSLLLITGAKKVRKTFLAYNLGIAIAGGYSFAGFKTNKEHKVLIFSAEGGYYPNRDRIKKMCECIDIKNPNNFNICFDSRIRLENDRSYDFIIEKIKELKSEVIIIDPFVKFHHLEENSAMDMGNILGKLRYLIEDHGISIILVHHLGKDQSRDARGSSAILGEYDSCITLSKGGSDDKNRIEFDLRHAISPEPISLIFDQENFWFYEDISPIVLLINEHGPMNKQDLAELCYEKKLYKAKNGGYRAIDRAVIKEQIKLNSDNLYEVVQS